MPKATVHNMYLAMDSTPALPTKEVTEGEQKGENKGGIGENGICVVNWEMRIGINLVRSYIQYGRLGDGWYHAVKEESGSEGQSKC